MSSDNSYPTMAMEQGFDYQAAEQKIKELQTLKTALSYEIGKNKQVASELQLQIKSLGEKIDSNRKMKAELQKELDLKVAEIEGANEQTRKARIERELEFNDLKKQRIQANTERDELERRRSEFKERCAGIESNLALRQQEIEAKEKSVGHKLKEVDGRLSTLSVREDAFARKMEDANMVFLKAESDKLEGQKILTEAKTLMDEALAQKTSNDADRITYRQDMESLLGREAVYRTSLDELALEKSRLEEKERDLIILESKIENIRDKFLKEIQVHKIDEARKKAYASQLEK